MNNKFKGNFFHRQPHESVDHVPVACKDAVAILFMFDLTSRSTLNRCGLTFYISIYVYSFDRKIIIFIFFEISVHFAVLLDGIVQESGIRY